MQACCLYDQSLLTLRVCADIGVPRIIPDCKGYRKVRSYFLWCKCVACLTLMLLSTVCVNSLGCLIFSYYLPTLCVCIHSRLYPLCICVNSACVDPACLCCLCWPCWLVSLRPLSVSRRCLYSLCLCALVCMWTRCVCDHYVFLPTLCLCAHSMSLCTLYVFVPTLMSLCPRCVFAHPLVSAHSGVNSACVVCAHPLRCLRPLCFCPHCGLLVFLSIHHISAYCTSCIWQNIHLDPWIFIFEKKWNLTNQQRNKIFKPHSAPWR